MAYTGQTRFTSATDWQDITKQLPLTVQSDGFVICYNMDTAYAALFIVEKDTKRTEINISPSSTCTFPVRAGDRVGLDGPLDCTVFFSPLISS